MSEERKCGKTLYGLGEWEIGKGYDRRREAASRDRKRDGA